MATLLQSDTPNAQTSPGADELFVFQRAARETWRAKSLKCQVEH